MTAEYTRRYSDAEFAAMDDPQFPDRFQNYLLDRNKIGEGPTCYSYRAKRIDTNQTVRLRVVRKRICELQGIAELHQKLARVSSQYVSDNVLQLHSSPIHNSIYIFEFEYFESISLGSLIAEHAPFHPDFVALIAIEAIAGLNQIHGMRPSPGMGNLIPLHRNLKPENILISASGRVKLCDIDMNELSRFCDIARLELPYTIHVYESPEQLLRDGYADRRSDIYSLGMIMLEMMTGRFPYRGSNIFEVRQNIREDRRIDLESLLPSTQDSDRRKLLQTLKRIIGRMIDHEPDKRFQNFVEIESELGKYFLGAKYSDPHRSIADFLRVRSFNVEREKKKGFIDRLFGG